jgi:hypothetical protein
VRVRPESPYNLAVFRVAVCAILLSTTEWRLAPTWSALPVALRAPPEGLVWLASAVPIAPSIARVVAVVFVVSTACGFLGLFTRPVLFVATLSALYLLALSQLSGSVLHDMHLIWFAALLAASPSGDVLSLDAWRARRRGTPLSSHPSEAYAWPLVTARVLLGLIYFFPGFWKIATSGWAWITSDNLRNQLYWKWYEHDWIPALRIDASPALCHLCAFGVVVFELSFLPLSSWRRTRPFAAVAGVVFHVATQAMMRIGFFALWGTYVVLFDWAWLEEREPAGVRRSLGRAWPLGVFFIGAVLVQGARGAVQAWPFACYPTFAEIAGTQIPDIVLTTSFADGHTLRLPTASKSQAAWGTAWMLGRRRLSEEMMRAYWQRTTVDPRVDQLARGAREVRFSRGWFSVLPADRGRPPLREEPLGAITLP